MTCWSSDLWEIRRLYVRRLTAYHHSHCCQAQPELFFHSRMGLQERLDAELKAESPDEEFITDLKTALEYMYELYNPTINELHDLLAHQEITFVHLWALIEPNTYIYHHTWHTEQDQILLAKSFDILQRQDGSKYGSIICDIIGDDGNAFGLVKTQLQIEYFRGAKAIQDLEAYPLRFHPKAEALRKDIIARGKKFTELKKSYKEVSGPALTEVNDKIRKISVSSQLIWTRALALWRLIASIGIWSRDDRPRCIPSIPTECSIQYRCVQGVGQEVVDRRPVYDLQSLRSRFLLWH